MLLVQAECDLCCTYPSASPRLSHTQGKGTGQVLQRVPLPCLLQPSMSPQSSPGWQLMPEEIPVCVRELKRCPGAVSSLPGEVANSNYPRGQSPSCSQTPTPHASVLCLFDLTDTQEVSCPSQLSCRSGVQSKSPERPREAPGDHGHTPGDISAHSMVCGQAG